ELLPYYSRSEIDQQGILSGRNLEIVWVNDRIDSAEYTGYTHKGFRIMIADLQEFIDAVRDVASSTFDRKYRFELTPTKELVVYRPGENQVDIRHYAKTDDYVGFLRKGIRMVSSNAIKLTDGLVEVAAMLNRPDPATGELGDSVNRWAVHDACCKTCGTVRRPHFREGYCAVCYERENRHGGQAQIDLDLGETIIEKIPSVSDAILETAYTIHGKRCYICNHAPAKVGALDVYFADGNIENVDEDNVYPICEKCRSLV
ncbi:hypothetical protein B7Z28_00165, partial [Candidatus Saccharibacteria bacterium 32-45-3]